MARPHIQEEPSPYYPPRARWYAQFFYLVNRVRLQKVLDRLEPSSEVRIVGLVASFLMPGVGVYLRGPRGLGVVAMTASAVMALVFIVFLGYPAANLGFGLLIALHCSGFVYYFNPYLGDASFRHRLSFTLLALLGIALAMYLPLRNTIQGRWLRPLRYEGRVFVLQRMVGTGGIHRGDWVAYWFHESETGEAHNGGAIYVSDGAGLGPILAMPGDHVDFHSNSFSVNGIEWPALPRMPTSGDLTVGQNQWFIWPNLGVYSHGIAETTITGTLMGLAKVNETQFIGRPYKSWFGRKQNLP